MHKVENTQETRRYAMIANVMWIRGVVVLWSKQGVDSGSACVRVARADDARRNLCWKVLG
jgi:hypothetical protein